MQLTYVLELLKLTKRKQNIFFNNIAEVVKNRRAIADKLKSGETKLSSADFKEINLPFAVKNQNYKIDNHIIYIPLYTNKCERVYFPVKQTKRFRKLLQHIKNDCKLGKASLFYKKGKWYFAITIKIADKENTNSNVMGIDIGLRQLAVASVKTPKGRIH